jgi:hypothetical protein
MSTTTPNGTGSPLAPKKRVPLYTRPTKASSRKTESAADSKVTPLVNHPSKKPAPLRPSKLISNGPLPIANPGMQAGGAKAPPKPKVSTIKHCARYRESADQQVLSDRHVGRLFMDGGHEEILIRILEKVRKEDLGACMRVSSTYRPSPIRGEELIGVDLRDYASNHCWDGIATAPTSSSTLPCQSRRRDCSRRQQVIRRGCKGAHKTTNSYRTFGLQFGPNVEPTSSRPDSHRDPIHRCAACCDGHHIWRSFEDAPIPSWSFKDGIEAIA